MSTPVTNQVSLAHVLQILVACVAQDVESVYARYTPSDSSVFIAKAVNEDSKSRHALHPIHSLHTDTSKIHDYNTRMSRQTGAL